MPVSKEEPLDLFYIPPGNGETGEDSTTEVPKENPYKDLQHLLFQCLPRHPLYSGPQTVTWEGSTLLLVHQPLRIRNFCISTSHIGWKVTSSNRTEFTSLIRRTQLVCIPSLKVWTCKHKYSGYEHPLSTGMTLICKDRMYRWMSCNVFVKDFTSREPIFLATTLLTEA